MKKSKIICFIVAILSLLVSILAFSASAEGDAELAIASKNISYDNNLKFVVAVPKSAIEDTVTLTIDARGEIYSVTKTVASLASDSINDPTVNGIECYAIISDFGIPLKDMAMECILTVASGGKTAEISYSMAEYLYERLFGNEVVLAEEGTPDADRRSLYFSTLATGADAERVLYNLNDDKSDDITTFVDEYFYSNITGTPKLYKAGDKVSITEFTSVYRYEESADVWTCKEVVLAPGEIEIDSHILLSGKSCITDFEDDFGSYLTRKPAGVTYASCEVISENTPDSSDGSVLKVTQKKLSSSHNLLLGLSPMYSKDGGNIYVFDFDANFTTPNVTNSTRYLMSIDFGGATVHVNTYKSEVRINGTTDAHLTGYKLNEWGSYRLVFEVTASRSAKMYVYAKSFTSDELTLLHTATLSGTGISTTGVSSIGISCYNNGSSATVPYTYYLDNLSFIRTDDASSYVPFEWNSTDAMNLVTEGDGAWVDSLKSKFKTATGVELTVSATAGAHALLVGDTGCAASDVAYSLLEQYLASSEYDDSEGYVIYVENGSVAVAYNSTVARVEAINNLLNLAAKTDLLTLNGEIKSDVYSLIERAEESREAMHQAQLDEIERKLLGAGRTDASVIRAELEQFFSYYDTNIITWLANLYDKGVGGFYFSNSARDTVGFMPDVESTAMAFKLMDDGGLFDEFGGLLAHGIPDFMCEPMTNWILGMQGSDGYFYHPQWGEEVGDVRKGRDIDSVVYLLNRLRVKKTYYSIPGHHEFGIISKTTGASAVSLTSPLNRSKISAVSNVVAVASTISLPSYLQTPEAWEAYLDALNINGAEKSYPVGNWLCSTVGTVREADIQWKEKTGEKAVFSTIALEFLNETQIPEIGLWEWNNGSRKNDIDPDDGIGYNGTNGLMKISVAYSGYNSSRTSEGFSVIPMNNAYNALQSAVKVALYGEDPRNNETVCYLLNNWTCISSTLGTVKAYDADNYPEAKQLVLSSLADLIKASTTLLADHSLKSNGGGFKYYESSPCNAGNGTPVAYSPVAESDINAVTVCTTATINNIFSTMRKLVPSISPFRLWCAEDYYIFMNELENVSAVVKTVPDAERVTFDDYVYDEESTSQNVSNPSDLVYIGNINENYHSSTVVDSTKPGAVAGDKILRLETFGITSTTKPSGPLNAYATFANALEPVENECYLFEADFCIDGVKQDDTPLQISFLNPLNGKWISGFTIRTRSNPTVYEINDGYVGLDGSYESHRTTIKTGNWFTLKMKLYKIYDASGNLTVMTKVYINDNFIYETDCAEFGGDGNTTEIGRVNISAQRFCNSIIYVDNILCEKLDEAYVSGNN